MRATPVSFTTAGIIEPTAGADPSGNKEVEVVGVAFTGFTSVIVYNGTDATGDVVLNCPSAGTYGANYELLCYKGCYVAVTGSGKGTVWVV